MLRNSSGTVTAAAALLLVAVTTGTVANQRQTDKPTLEPGYAPPYFNNVAYQRQADEYTLEGPDYDSPADYNDVDTGRHFVPNMDNHDHMHYDTRTQDPDYDFNDIDTRRFDPNLDNHDHIHYDTWTLAEDGPQHIIDYIFNHVKRNDNNDEYNNDSDNYIPGYENDDLHSVNSAERIESIQKNVNERPDLLNMFPTKNNKSTTDSSETTEDSIPTTEDSETPTENNTPTVPGCSCGIAKSSRILGGQDVDIPQKYPWAVLVTLIKNHAASLKTCGGSIIGESWVLTAAHCVVVKSRCSVQYGCKFPSRQCYLNRKTSRTFTQVTIGGHQNNKGDDDTQEIFKQIKVYKEFIHPKFNSCKSKHNDFALLELEESLTFTDHLMPVCLPATNFNTYGCTTATVIGWGKYDYNIYSTSTTLKEHNTTILEKPWCGLWNNDGDMDQSQLCAGGEVAGEGFCHGDHGGALMVSDSAGLRLTLVGIASKVYENCGHKYWPDVYARVTEAMPWINTIANGSICTA